MPDPKNIRIEEYDYVLPPERIAQYPLEQRDRSRLLFYNQGAIGERKFLDLPQLLPHGTMLVFNNTRVIRARFVFYKTSGARIEVFCIEPIAPTAELVQAFASHTQSHWKCYVGSLKKWKTDKLELKVELHGMKVSLFAEKILTDNDIVNIRFTWSDSSLSFSEIMDAAGHIPLPPYINRPDEPRDAQRYQTIYAREQGSVAAPTAGLHFSQRIFAALAEKHIQAEEVTLHVGAGTFKPVSSEMIGEHQMHAEVYQVTRDFIEKLAQNTDGTIVAVGTTSMRTLESLYWLGAKIARQGKDVSLHTNQWEPYEQTNSEISTLEAMQALLVFLDQMGNQILHASSGLLIAPGYRFRVCNGLVTNFHLPKSTLLLLVAALIGPDWKKAYELALANQFRFLSYGDACLFIPRVV